MESAKTRKFRLFWVSDWLHRVCVPDIKHWPALLRTSEFHKLKRSWGSRLSWRRRHVFRLFKCGVQLVFYWLQTYSHRILLPVIMAVLFSVGNLLGFSCWLVIGLQHFSLSSWLGRVVSGKFWRGRFIQDFRLVNMIIRCHDLSSLFWFVLIISASKTDWNTRILVPDSSHDWGTLSILTLLLLESKMNWASRWTHNRLTHNLQLLDEVLVRVVDILRVVSVSWVYKHVVLLLTGAWLRNLASCSVVCRCAVSRYGGELRLPNELKAVVLRTLVFASRGLKLILIKDFVLFGRVSGGKHSILFVLFLFRSIMDIGLKLQEGLRSSL